MADGCRALSQHPHYEALLAWLDKRFALAADHSQPVANSELFIDEESADELLEAAIVQPADQAFGSLAAQI
jgi:hypothetical protein